jgi:mannitol/fructose-specific phosphotransferase system IIA component (Ntr-type)
MRMTDFVVREAIVAELTATTKEGVIREMVESLRNAGYFKGGEPEDIVKAILKREALGSTGIGRGVAIPHTKHASVDRLVGTVAVSRGGVNFNSVDGEPVYLLVLLVSPQDRPGDHLRALENVARSMRDDSFVRSLRQCTTREAIWSMLDEAPGQ